MRNIEPREDVNQHRRRLFGAAALAVAASKLGFVRPANAQDSKALPAIKPGTNTSLGPLKQVDAGVVNVGYAEAGPANGPVVILLHG